MTPKRELHGIGEARDQLTWVSPPDNLDVEFDQPELTDLGDGRIVSDVHEIYRLKGTGEFAYARERRIELTIRDGRIAPLRDARRRLGQPLLAELPHEREAHQRVVDHQRLASRRVAVNPK